MLAPLQDSTEDAFVVAVTEGQPIRPRYFSFDARSNRWLHALFDWHTPELLDLEGVFARREAGAVLLDPREPAEFAPTTDHRPTRSREEGWPSDRGPGLP